MKTNHSFLLGVYQSRLNNVKIKIDTAMNAYKSGASLENLLRSIEAIQALPFLQDKMKLEVEPFEFKVPDSYERRSRFREKAEIETETLDSMFTVAMLACISGCLVCDSDDSDDDVYVLHPFFDIDEISVFDNEGTEVYNYDIDELASELKNKLTITV